MTDSILFFPARLNFEFHGITDPGADGIKNQDSFFITKLPESEAIIFGVFDGHGKSLGHIASTIAKKSFKASFKEPDAIIKLKKDPQVFFNEIFKKAHNDIRDTFKDVILKKGILLSECDGYLYRERDGKKLAVQGGTTATICVIVDNYKYLFFLYIRLYVANTGDSLAVLGGGEIHIHPASYNYSELTRIINNIL